MRSAMLTQERGSLAIFVVDRLVIDSRRRGKGGREKESD